MKTRHLRAFLAVAHASSFARASEQLHMSQPALSMSIRGLEDELGGKLLTRTTRQVRLTPEGTALLPMAMQLLADMDNAQEQMRQRFTLQRGHVSIAAMPSVAGNLLPAILKKYRNQYPAIQVSVHDVLHEDVVAMVEHGRVELGVGFEPESSDRVAFQPLFTDRFIAVVPSDSVVAGKPRVAWSQLLQYDFITLQRPSSLRRWLESTLTNQGIAFSVALECHHLATIGQLVAAGLGVSVVPALCRPHMISLGAKCLPVIQPTVKRAVGLLTRRDQELSTAGAALSEALTSHQHSQ